MPSLSLLVCLSISVCLFLYPSLEIGPAGESEQGNSQPGLEVWAKTAAPALAHFLPVHWVPWAIGGVKMVCGRVTYLPKSLWPHCPYVGPVPPHGCRQSVSPSGLQTSQR